jgi:hypothetical protein
VVAENNFHISAAISPNKGVTEGELANTHQLTASTLQLTCAFCLFPRKSVGNT